jgi:hypothetical protein
MHHAAEAAPQIDRLVWAVNRAAEARHIESITSIAGWTGLEGPGHIDHFADWLTTIGVTREVARSRLVYLPKGSVDRWFDKLEELRLVSIEDDGRVVARPSLYPLANALLDARADVAARLWSGHERPLRRIVAAARAVAQAAPADYGVAASHRDIPDLRSIYLTAHTRLVTLRYLRQHAHVVAWRSAELTADEIWGLTALWTDRPDDRGRAAIEAKGLADSAGLTEQGRALRSRIEVETDHRMAKLFAVLDQPAADRFLSDLTALPGSPPS